jgi:hypothetical protein
MPVLLFLQVPPIFCILCIQIVKVAQASLLAEQGNKDDDVEIIAEPTMQVVKANQSFMEVSDLACDDCSIPTAYVPSRSTVKDGFMCAQWSTKASQSRETAQGVEWTSRPLATQNVVPFNH